MIVLFLFPALAALLVPALTVVNERCGRGLGLAAYVAGAVYGVSLLPRVFEAPVSVITAGWLPPYGINFLFSPFSVGLVVGIYAIAALLTVFDAGHMPRRKGQYALLHALLVMAASAAVLTADIFNLFVFLEIAAISAFALVAAGRDDAGPEGALRYLVPAQLASLLMLAGIGLLYSATGLLNMGSLAQAAPAGAAAAGRLAAAPALNPAFAFLVGSLLLLPLLLETKLFPFNSWVAGAYSGALPSMGALLSGVMALAAGGVLARLLLTLMGEASVFGAAASRLRLLVVVLGSATILVGELAAFREGQLKRMLGFSSIAQMGMVAAGIALASPDTVRGALLLLVNHAAVKAMLFLLAGSLIDRAGSGSWRRMAGLGRSRPLVGALFAAGALALIGVPPFAGFWGKLGLLKGAFALGSWGAVTAVAVLLATVLEGIYYLRVAHRLFEPASADAEGAEDAEAAPRAGLAESAALLAPALVLAAAVIAVGVAPRLIEPWLASAAGELLDPAGYAALILGRTP